MSASTRIDDAFANARSAGRMAFMPFITAGDPDMATTVKILRELARQGVDLIEVGIPYSDPIADGPVIQASYSRALDRKTRVADIFSAVASLRDEQRIPPLVAMVSYAIVFRSGSESFVKQAKDAGFSGFIVPDLPADESHALGQLASSQGLPLIQLVAPTTSPERAERILRASRGFVYCISVAGTTGERRELPAALADQLRWLRPRTELPLAVGFGVSRAEQVQTLRGLADGIIVGSAIVRQLERFSTGTERPEDIIADIGHFAATMVHAVEA